MPIYATNQDANSGGVTFEDVAEEVLNGILCHYEPPTSAAAQRKAVDLVVSGSFSNAAEMKQQRQSRSHAGNHGVPPPPPELLRRQSKSILKPSRLTRGASDINQTRSVTWRDHKNANKNIPKNMEEVEQRMASCVSSNCDFLQESTAEDQEILNEIRNEQQQQQQPMDPIEAFRQRKSPKISSMKSKQQSDGKKKNDAPKKMLYDDEGNPISDDEDEEDDIIFHNDENAEPTKAKSGMSPGPESAVPPPPPATKTSMLLGSLYGLANVCGLNVGGPNMPPGSMSAIPTPTNGSDKKGFHQQPGEGKPPSSQSLPYRRMRSPPAPSNNNDSTDSDDDSEAIFDGVETPKKKQRGRLPQKSRNGMREYDDTDDDENEDDFKSRRKANMQRNRRPQTPHRSDESWDEDVDREMRRRSSPGGRGRGRSSRRPSSAYSDGYDDEDTSSNESGFEVDEYYKRGRKPSKSRSPARRRSGSAGRRQSRELELRDGELSLGGPIKPKPKENGARRSRRGRDVDEYETDDESGRDSPVAKSGGPRFGKASKSRKPMKIETSRTPRGAKGDDTKRKSSITSPRAAYEAAISPKTTPSKGKSSPSKTPRKWRLGSKGAWKHADDISLTSLQNMASKKKQNANSVTRATPVASNQTHVTMARRVERATASNGTNTETITSISEAVAARAARINNGRTSPEPIDTGNPGQGKSAGADRTERNIRDPTPRRDVSNASSRGNNNNISSLRNARQPLPPTPRRVEKQAQPAESNLKKETERSVPKKNNGMSRHIDIREDHDAEEARDSGVSSNTKSRSSSPTSTATMNTEAEVREEVSSVGMESSTLRPHIENPFQSIPQSVLRSEEQHADGTGDSNNKQSDLKPPRGDFRSKKSAKQIDRVESDVSSEQSSKGSERSSSKKKGLFSGWRKKKGKVKAIAKEIEKDELPGPMLRVGISVE